MRTDVKQALRGRSLSFLGAYREINRLENYLHDDEEVHDLLACSFGDTGGRALLVVTDERVLVYKDGWIFKNSQGMSYGDIRSMEVRTGLFFAKIKFKGEGMSFEISKAGRFSTEHAVKIIRSRIGSRYASWENQRLLQRSQREQAQQGHTSPQPEQPAQPAAFYQTDEPLTLDQFLPPKEEKQATSSSGNLIDELERLQSLRDRGLLTAEEHTAAKQKLLG